MNIKIKSKNYTVVETGKGGREGEIYTILNFDDSKAVKIYEEEKRTPQTQRKVSAFINKFRNINLGGVEKFVAYPELQIYDSETRQYLGFLMKYFNNHLPFFQNSYDLNQKSFKNTSIDDDIAEGIISTLFAYLEVLHKAGIILGDINPENILLVENFMPAIVDFDSAQLGTFYSSMHRIKYIDPSVRIDGVGRNKHFVYTIDSDIYAMAIVCYEFIIGIHPYFFQTTVATDTDYKKRNGICFIDFLENNKEKTNEFDFDIVKNPAFEATKERLNEINTYKPDLYNFFKMIFSNDERYYFGKIRFYINKRKIVDEHDNLNIELLPQSKEDPVELEVFMNQFNIKFEL